MPTCAGSRTTRNRFVQIIHSYSKTSAPLRFLALRARESGAPAKYLDRLGQITRTTGILGKRGGLRVKDKSSFGLPMCFIAQLVIVILIQVFGAQLSFA